MSDEYPTGNLRINNRAANALYAALWDLHSRVERKHSQNAGICIHDDFYGQANADALIENARKALAQARGERTP